MLERNIPVDPSVAPTKVIDPFEKFAFLPFYVVVNRQMIDAANLSSGERVLDLACGPGNLSLPIAEIIGPEGQIVAVDYSRKAVLSAKKRLEGVSPQVSIIQSRAEDVGNVLSALAGKFDAVICGNAIHNFTDKEKAVRGVCELLKDGGRFVFNTAYYGGTFSQQEKNTLYDPWIFKSLKRAVSLMLQLGLKREKKERVPAREFPPVWYFVKLLEENGFKISSLNVISVDVPISGFREISEDDEFSAGAISGVPKDIAVQALQETLDEMSSQLPETTPRKWLQVVAVKS